MTIPISDNLMKILAAIAGAVILGLQGANLNQTISAEHQVEATEKSLLQKMYELEIKMNDTANANGKTLERIERAVSSPSPAPH